MPFLIISVLIQVAFVIHVIKTGRNTTWIWVVLMLPVAGSIAYLILEVLPDASNTRAGRRARKTVSNTLNPNRDLKKATSDFAMSDTVENSRRLAEECFNRAQYAEAKALYQKCLSGLYVDDPFFLFGLAQCEFALENFNEAKAVLDMLIETNPDYKNQDAHLLYARSLDHLGMTDKARHEYETLYSYFSGPQAAYYYALFLHAQGQQSQSREILDNVIKKAGMLGKQYQSLHASTLKMVRRELERD